MTVRIARNPADFEAADGLAADVYRVSGLPQPLPICAGEDRVVLLAEVGGEVVGTMAIVFSGSGAVATRFAIQRRSVLSSWSVLVAGALEEMARRKVLIMATVVNPATQDRWQRCLGLITVARGTYEELGGVPAVVMVGSVPGMLTTWNEYCRG
ncbi:hypothetical protein LCGC14_2077550 [marine sediment metagenome]|uniref:N-acetyltransferase domain-containing protein n=1 Tax=marine sediment metagenome TaxID=412755 RepID=A0A0F9EGE3_9ZZZZ